MSEPEAGAQYVNPGPETGGEVVNVDNKSEKKKHRVRMRKIYTQIREQMEFYFSDANLHRDRFLKKLMNESKDGFVDLEVFKNFNKMKSISTDTELIAKALRKTSQVLEVNKDGLSVKRIKPLLPPENIDEKTIYVECLPPNTDHEHLKRIFELFGKVAYVSLPRYKSTHDIKGFAFIEFETEEAAQKACQKAPVVPSSAERPGIFPKASKKMKAIQKQLQKQEQDVVQISSTTSTEMNNQDEPVSKKQKLAEKESENIEDKGDQKSEVTPPKSIKKAKKRKLAEDSESASDGDNVKKTKMAEVKMAITKVSGDESVGPKKEIMGVLKRKRKSDADTVNDDKSIGDATKDKVKKVKFDEDVDKKSVTEVVPSVSDGEPGKKKKRKQKKKRNKDPKAKDILQGLRIIPKTEWLELKKEYLALQKTNMVALKRSLTELKKQKEKLAISESEQKNKSKTLLDFIPGVIVHVTASEPMTRNQLKSSLPSSADVAYIDVKDGLTSGHIRFKTADGANKSQESPLEGYTLKLLEGDDEKTYWNRLHADREAKLSSKRKPKKRGSEKILDKAEKLAVGGSSLQRKHIHFGDRD